MTFIGQLLAACLLLATMALLLPVTVLFVQIVAASWPQRREAIEHEADAVAPAARAAVLMPAHNEAHGIAAAIASVCGQLRPGDRLLVVADNCSDATAAVAAAAGAEVLVRHDLERRGKGYALDHGVRHLASDPPDVLVMLDADCQLHAGGLSRLVRHCAARGRPIQALYLMHTASSAGLRMRTAEFAWKVKNELRPLGAWRLGGPCQLMGTGMAFPWPLIASAPLASGHLVEDMKLGIDLARAGRAPRFAPDVLVTSRFPEGDAATRQQRTRWEHGHLATLLADGPALLLAGLRQRDAQAMALAADLLVPPLALLLALGVVLAALDGALAWLLPEHATPAWLGLLMLGLLAASVALAWHRAGRALISFGELLRAPLYALWKIPVYVGFLLRKQVEWVRAKRDDE